MNTIYVKLVAGREELGGYVKYVFAECFTGKYILCTKFPNWDSPPIQLGTKGYLKYKEIIAGRDMWYDVVTNTMIPYKFDVDQFIDFIPEPKCSDATITI